MSHSFETDTRTPRLFVEDPLAAQASVRLDGQSCHYLMHVLRKKPGDAVRLFNGRDGEWQADISHISKGALSLNCRAQSRPQRTEPGPHLLFTPLKKARLDYLIEKATELGAARLSPIITRHSGTDRVKLERLHAQSIEAAEQCERLTLPALDPVQSFSACLSSWPEDEPLYVCVERQDLPGLDQAGPTAAVAIGPEGGWHGDELSMMADKAFIRPVSLGPRILRAETAAMAALVLMGQ